ncbi:hypothetical protein [Photobacterium leiognathi]|uniref:hypothetical protein n=1 Tax=Photobacterium leiognathi TaxID=553611 RepID=UPI002981DA2D|nr:hypothetical protein [Photobacterium leiognathi]
MAKLFKLSLAVLIASLASSVSAKPSSLQLYELPSSYSFEVTELHNHVLNASSISRIISIETNSIEPITKHLSSFAGGVGDAISLRNIERNGDNVVFDIAYVQTLDKTKSSNLLTMNFSVVYSNGTFVVEDYNPHDQFVLNVIKTGD